MSDPSKLTPEAQLLIEEHVRKKLTQYLTALTVLLGLFAAGMVGWLNATATSTAQNAIETQRNSIDEAYRSMVKNLAKTDSDFEKALDESKAKAGAKVLDFETEARGSIGKAQSEAEAAAARLVVRTNELNLDLNTIEALLEKGTSQLADDEGFIERLATKLNAAPAARYRCPPSYFEKLTVDSEPGTIINFSQMDYDTHNAVTDGKNWKYNVKKSGIYSVTAYAICSLKGGASSAGHTVVALYKNGTRSAYLAQQNNLQSFTNTMIGGTTNVELHDGEAIDIRVHVIGNVSEASIGSANATWFSIHYVRSLPEPKP